MAWELEVSEGLGGDEGAGGAVFGEVNSTADILWFGGAVVVVLLLAVVVETVLAVGVGLGIFPKETIPNVL